MVRLFIPRTYSRPLPSLRYAYGDRCKREDLLEVFDSYDADCSAILDHAELGALVKGLGVTLSHEELVLLAGSIDKDGSGEVRRVRRGGRGGGGDGDDD
jgi:Ca2+-binding EF-hand superfamily protein